MTSSPRVKVDPSLQDEQDDLLMSYLNADCLSSEPHPGTGWTEQPSTVDKNVNDVKAWDTPTMDTARSFMVHNDFQQSDLLHHYWPASPAHGPALSAAAAAAAAMMIPNHIIPIPPPAVAPAAFFQTQPPSSPCSSSSASSTVDDSSDEQNQPLSTSSVSSVLSVPTGEDQQNRRGRKKKRVSLSPTASSAILPIAPATPVTTPPPRTSKEGHAKAVVKPPTTVPSVTTPVKSETRNAHFPNDGAAAAYAKRQERLIKNRAAALLSRKRKREHVNALEEENRRLLEENEALKSRIACLEQEERVKTKDATKKTFSTVADATDPKTTSRLSTAGVMLMVNDSVYIKGGLFFAYLIVSFYIRQLLLFSFVAYLPSSKLPESKHLWKR